MKLEQLLAYKSVFEGLEALYKEFDLLDSSYEIDKDHYNYESNCKLKELYGWNYTDLWNLDDSIFRFLLPRLYAFYKADMYCDEQLEEGSFKEIIERILGSLLIVLSQEIEVVSMSLDDYKKEQEYIRESFTLFGKYIYKLWN